MKILVVSDTHGLVPKEIDKFDLIIHCGDISYFEEDLGKILKKWDALNLPIFFIHGNHESQEAVEFYMKKLKNFKFIHNEILEFNGIIIGGIGGGGFSYSNPDTKILEEKLKKFNRIDIFVTHAPPYNTLLDLLFEDHVGNLEFRKFIEKYQPKFAFSGHLHENFQVKDKIGNTILINPGYEGVVIEI
ncbi:MAG: metallophosphoesterase [Candidatus Woesearchaeota archaeon]